MESMPDMDHTHAHGAHAARASTPPPAPASGNARHANDGEGDGSKHAGHSVAMFRSKFRISIALTVPTLIWGHMLPSLFGYTAPFVPGTRWIPSVFGMAVFLYGGRPFIAGAVREIRHRIPGMMTLISLAISVAAGFSLAVTAGFPGMPLWEELATLVTVMLLGHWIEMRSIATARGAVAELAKLLPATAERVVGGPGGETVETVPLQALARKDVVLVRPGAAVPADGVVTSGRSSVNEANLTGESRPVDKSPGSAVVAGTANGGGSLRVEITGVGGETMLAGIIRLVEQAQNSKGRTQVLADRAAFGLTLVALGAGAATLITWLALGATPAFAIERLVAVLVIACPHALGLAVPLVVAISTTLAARAGLLVRNQRGLENARLLDTVVFDKTGTLTVGEFRVAETKLLDLADADTALRLAASVERDSEHPVARAFVATAAERGIAPVPATEFEAMAGLGVRARVEGRTLAVGGPNLLASLGIPAPPAAATFVAQAATRGQGSLYLVEGQRVLAVFAVADVPRPESAEAVRRLRAAGITVVMMTGDAQAPAESIARELGIDTVLAQVLPADKASRIADLRRSGKRVAMVGDGVNDAPALATADVGIAIGAGTDVAVEAGDIVLVRSDPRDVARIVSLSAATYRKMIQNLWWAAGYNIVAIPLAAGILASRGLILSPAIGAVLMSLSTVVVAINARLLRTAE
ncbi:MAG: heavy metal translocating P-type ATPase [Gemmatimonadales bacterium]|nr:heavy metal translocating P-type ATPase [Gemmatimonadales bacterium]